ncbi:MAG: hypothetical protein GWN32_02440, partial [Gemmatimonadetes bacterium]|nr:hypothetical protein [Gemmatimonadota bacterium]
PKPRPSPIVWIRISLSGLILWAGLACASQAAYAQQEQDAARLVGVVTDRLTSRPAIGAEIQVVGLPLRTLTDEEGWFLLEGIPPGERIVE